MKTNVLSSKLLFPVALFLAFLSGYYLTTYQFSLLRIADEFLLDNAQLGVLIGTNYISQMFVPILFGILADKKGKKIMLFISCAVWLVGMGCLFVAADYIILSVCVFAMGAGFGSTQALYLSSIGDAYPDKVTKYTNFTLIMFSIGAFFSPIISQQLVNNGLLWRSLFIPLITMLAIGVILLIFTKFAKMAAKKEAAVQAAASGGQQIKPGPIYKNPLFYIIIIAMMLYMGIETPTSSYADTYMVRNFGAEELSALSLSLYWIMMVPSRFLAGFIKDRHLTLMMVFNIAVAAVSVLIATTGNATVAFIGFIACGFLSGPMFPTIYSFGMRTFPHATGTVSSVCTAFSGVGGTLFPAVMGFLSEGRSLSVVYICIAVVAFVGFLFNIVTRKAMHKQGIMIY
ncbi:MAG: MFS transporter [Christensenellaceae bacterium]|jgi:FHS family glucose/mannose:H+ symporter-like MFS transporter